MDYKKIDKSVWKDIKKRLLLVLISLFLLFSYIFYNIFSLYFIKGKEYQVIANKQYKSYLKINTKRGSIFDRNLKKLAISIPTKSLYAFPKRINKQDRAIKILEKELKLDYNYLFRKLFSKNSSFVYVKRMLDKEVSDKLQKIFKKEKITGFGFDTESKRFYPQQELSAQILGFTGMDSKGLYGIERKFNKSLKFKGDKLRGLKNAKRDIISLNEKTIDFSGKYHQVVLTIDSFIQFITEEELKNGVINSGAKKGVAIVMKADTGEIYAMAQYPTFNPNHYKDVKSSLWKSLATSMVYEPGSTMKAISLASAIDSNVVSENTKFYCEKGEMRVGRYIIHDSHAHETLTVAEILAVSSNIGTLKIINKLGRKKFYDYVNSFHFGKKFKFELPNEKGLMQPYKRWKTAALANIAFGQGIAITPLQLITAFSALINGGNLMQPKLIDSIIDEKQKIVKKIKPKILKRVISTKTSKVMRRLLQKVVSVKGTAPRAMIRDVEVGGKTGTAQKIDPIKRGYSDKRVSSFIGYFKKDDVEYVILVIMDEPSSSNYGGVVAAPVFRNIAIKILKYFHRSPAEEDLALKLDLPSFEENSILLESLSSLDDLEKKLLENSDKKRKKEVKKKRVPNFIGLTTREALRLSEKMDIEIEISGNGIVYKTIPKEFAVLKANDIVKLFFKEEEF